MKILAVCYMGMNRSKYLAEYLRGKGYECDYAGILPETKNLVSQERVDGADVLIFIQPRIQEKFLWEFKTKGQRIITLDVEDRVCVLRPENTEMSGVEYLEFQKRHVYTELERQIEKFLPFEKGLITCKNNFGEIVTIPREKFKFRPSVYGFVRNKGKMCVCKLQSTGKIWFPGGGIEVGERREEALLREIKEEAGLRDVRVKKLQGVLENFFYYQPTDEAMQAYLFFYECEAEESALNSNEMVDDEEATDFEWVEIDQIRKEDLADLNEEIFEMLKGLGQKN